MSDSRRWIQGVFRIPIAKNGFDLKKDLNNKTLDGVNKNEVEEDVAGLPLAVGEVDMSEGLAAQMFGIAICDHEVSLDCMHDA